MRHWMILFLFAIIAADSNAAPKIGPAFDCAKAATPIEKEICSSDLLSFLDLYLADIYQLSLKKTPEEAEELKKAQRDWLKNARNNRCLKGDFSWSSDEHTLGIDAVSTKHLEKCYVLRTAEIIHRPCDDEELCNRYKKILSEVHKIPELMSTIGSDEQEFLIEYGKKYNALKALDPAEKYVLDKRSEHVLADIFSKCFGVRPSIYYRNGNFFIVQYFGSTVCGGISIPSNEKENLCIQNGAVVAVDNFWQCKGKNNANAILQALVPIINTTNFSEKIENFSSYDSQNSYRSTPESYLISTISSLPLLTYNHPALYSPETMDWIDSNHLLMLAAIGDYKDNALTILQDLKYMHAAIIKEENWQEKLSGIITTQERRFLGFGVEDQRIMKSSVVGTIYTLHDVYILSWARVYKYGDMQKTLQTIDKLILAIESKIEK